LSLAFAHVGNGTDYFSISPLFFGRRVIDVQSPKRQPPTIALSKKLHSLPSSIRRIIQPRGWLVLAFSAGGDGGRRPPDLPRRNPHTSFAAASDCRTIAIYEYTSRNGEVMERQLGLPDHSGLMFAARITFAHGSLRRGQERVMTKKMLLAGVAVAAPSVVSATAAAAQAPRAGVTVLQNEPGGYLAIYQYRFETLAANGDSVEIRGKCLSACTLVLAYIPRERLCFHETAWLGFHHASLSNGAVNEPTMRET
jgi:hypothetical protein